MELTAAQREAVEHRDGHLQLIACAGSGKTEVVARRVARLLGPAPPGAARVEPRNVVAFTFTEKAAAELEARIAARVREAHGELPGLAEMFVGTLHGFCLGLVRDEQPALAGRAVLDEVAQRMLVERHPERSGRARVTTLHGAPLEPWRDTGAYLAALDVLRQADVDPARVAGLPVGEALAAWRALLDDRGLLDYAGILEHAARALEGDAALRARLAARVRHVIVDEYQDVNPIQERVARALAGLGAWLCVVGDDDQSIYQWNGADVAGTLRFAERYPDVRVVRLQENFRSSGAVVRLARDFIAQNRERLPKAMVATGAQPDLPGEVVARGFEHPRDEAAWIAERFRALHGAPFDDGGGPRGLAWSDMAVLIRSDLRRNAAPVVERLRALDVPFVVSGLNNLFDAPEARAAADLFRYLADAGVTRDELRGRWAAALPGRDPAGLDGPLDYADAVRDEATYAGDPGDPSLWPQRVFLEFLARVGVGAEGGGRAEARVANLGVFSRLLDEFEAVHHHSAAAVRFGELASFLDHAAKDHYGEAAPEAALATPDAVRVLTVHKAKGLEWAVVAVPGLVEGRFPGRAFTQDPRKKKRKDWWDLVPLDAVPGGERYRGGLEDERRLFYVAVTRARRWLLLSYAPSPDVAAWRSPSQFLRFAGGHPDVARRERAPDVPVEAVARRGVGAARVDFTTLKHLFACPRRFQLQALYGFAAPPEPAQGFGASLHAALAEVHRRARDGAPCADADVPALVAAHLRLPYATPEVYAQRRAAAERIVRAHLARDPAALADVAFVEQPVALPMGDGVTVVGRVDLVVRRGDGRVSIVDLKSSAHAQSEAQSQAQLHLYALGYRALTGRDADAVEVWELDEGARDARPLDPAALDAVRADVAEAAAMLREGRFPPAPEPERCGACAVRGLCDAPGRAAEGGG